MSAIHRKILASVFSASLLATSFLMLFQPANSQSSAGESVNVNLNNVDIQALIETVSKRTGKNFIVDTRVRGKVTLISSEPINAQELYALFVSVLEVHGYATVPAGDFIKIVPMSVGVQSAVPIMPESSERMFHNDEVVSRVIRMEGIPLQPLVEVLRPLLPATATIGVEPSSNSLVITGRAANVTRIVEIVQQLK